MRGEFACLGGAEEIGRSARGETFFAPAEARLHHDTLSTSCGLSTVASPVATALDLSEVEDSGRACAMLLDASAGAAPDERFSLRAGLRNTKHALQFAHANIRGVTTRGNIDNGS